MAKLTPKQIEDTRRIAEIFIENPDIVKDYYNQLLDQAPDPQVDAGMLKAIKKSGSKDYYRHFVLKEMGEKAFDVRYRGKSAKAVDLGLR